MHLQCIRLLYNLTLIRHRIYKILKKLTNLLGGDPVTKKLEGPAMVCYTFICVFSISVITKQK